MIFFKNVETENGGVINMTTIMAFQEDSLCALLEKANISFILWVRNKEISSLYNMSIETTSDINESYPIDNE